MTTEFDSNTFEHDYIIKVLGAFVTAMRTEKNQAELMDKYAVQLTAFMVGMAREAHANKARAIAHIRAGDDLRELLANANGKDVLIWVRDFNEVWKVRYLRDVSELGFPNCYIDGRTRLSSNANEVVSWHYYSITRPEDWTHWSDEQ